MVDLALGRTSIEMMMTTTKAERVTVNDQSEIPGNGTTSSYLPTAFCIFSHLISSTAVRRSLTFTIALLRSS